VVKTIGMNRVLGAAALLFGVLTIASGGRALLGGAEARAALGEVVGFVLWFNALAGFAYVAVGAGLWARRSWTPAAAWLIAAATAVVALAFAAHVWSGGGYEARTVGAMTLRVGFWVLVAGLSGRAIGRR